MLVGSVYVEALGLAATLWARIETVLLPELGCRERWVCDCELSRCLLSRRLRPRRHRARSRSPGCRFSFGLTARFFAG